MTISISTSILVRPRPRRSQRIQPIKRTPPSRQSSSGSRSRVMDGPVSDEDDPVSDTRFPSVVRTSPTNTRCSSLQRRTVWPIAILRARWSNTQERITVSALQRGADPGVVEQRDRRGGNLLERCLGSGPLRRSRLLFAQIAGQPFEALPRFSHHRLLPANTSNGCQRAQLAVLRTLRRTIASNRTEKPAGAIQQTRRVWSYLQYDRSSVRRRLTGAPPRTTPVRSVLVDTRRDDSVHQ